MEVRASRVACRADIADNLTLVNARAAMNVLGEAIHVGISRGIGGIVADADIISVAAPAALHYDNAIARGHDWCALGRGEINALMHARKAQDRIPAPPEWR